MPEKRTLEFDGRQRSYLLHVPKQETPATGWPLVLAFHGSSVDAASMMAFCGLHEKADQAGFVAVFPNGSGRREDALTWNAGACCGFAAKKQIDDVGFVRMMLDDVASLLRIDPGRVYSTGMSAGGMMTYRLAVEMPERFAAIAAVGGPFCALHEPSQPMSVMHFHGTDDEYAPYLGGYGPRSISNVDFRSVDQTIGLWVKINECPPVPVVSGEPDHLADGTSIVRKVYGPGRDGTEVVLYAIEGAGHTWPGRQPRLPVLGRSTANLSANDAMWEFFQRHPKR